MYDHEEERLSSSTLIEYKGKDIDLVELVVALWLTGEFYVNGKPMTQAFFCAFIEKYLGRPMDNFHGKVQDLKKRKIEPTAKLTAMTKALKAYLGRLPYDRPHKK